MNPEDAVRALLAGAPDKRVVGRKRLQKLIYLLQLADADIEARYRLLHYGPFSADIANAAEFLSAIGKIQEDEDNSGVFGTYQSVYKLCASDIGPVFSENYVRLIQELSKFSTIDLEVAATIGYFQRAERLDEEDAIDRTRDMKPSKTVAPVVTRARKILQLVEEAR